MRANSKVDEEMDNYMHFSQSFLEIKEGKRQKFTPGVKSEPQILF